MVRHRESDRNGAFSDKPSRGPDMRLFHIIHNRLILSVLYFYFLGFGPLHALDQLSTSSTLTLPRLALAAQAWSQVQGEWVRYPQGSNHLLLVNALKGKTKLS